MFLIYFWSTLNASCELNPQDFPFVQADIHYIYSAFSPLWNQMNGKMRHDCPVVNFIIVYLCFLNGSTVFVTKTGTLAIVDAISLSWSNSSVCVTQTPRVGGTAARS